MGPRTPTIARIACALVAALLAVVLLGACGSSSSGNGVASKSPEEIVAAAKSAAASAATVHVSGSIVSEGKPISLDMELVRGKGAKGRITLEGLGIDVIALEDAFYLNGTAAFYKHVAGPAAAALLQGKWLKAPATAGEFASLKQLTDLPTLINGVLGSHGKLASAGTTTINGAKAVGVKDVQNGGTLYVAAEGTPYPLQVLKGTGGEGKVNFDSWNQPVSIAAPANAINITQLQNGH
jgi:hypothetical protein